MDKKSIPKKKSKYLKMKAPLFKLILVGDSGVGKTTFINTLLVKTSKLGKHNFKSKEISRNKSLY